MIKPAASAARKEEGGIKEPEYDQDCIVISPPGELARDEADGRARVARRWRLVGRQFGRIAAVSQLFSVLLFPQLFSTLHCAFRSNPRWRLAGPPSVRPLPFPPRPWPLNAKASHRLRRTFRYYRFSAGERSGNDGRTDHRKKHPSLSSPGVPSSNSYGKK